MTKETIEEIVNKAANNAYMFSSIGMTRKENFMEGFKMCAKWINEQDKKYTFDEMKNIAEGYWHYLATDDMGLLSFELWFRSYKNK